MSYPVPIKGADKNGHQVTFLGSEFGCFTQKMNTRFSININLACWHGYCIV